MPPRKYPPRPPSDTLDLATGMAQEILPERALSYADETKVFREFYPDDIKSEVADKIFGLMIVLEHFQSQVWDSSFLATSEKIHQAREYLNRGIELHHTKDIPSRVSQRMLSPTNYLISFIEIKNLLEKAFSNIDIEGFIKTFDSSRIDINKLVQNLQLINQKFAQESDFTENYKEFQKSKKTMATQISQLRGYPQTRRCLSLKKKIAYLQEKFRIMCGILPRSKLNIRDRGMKSFNTLNSCLNELKSVFFGNNIVAQMNNILVKGKKYASPFGRQLRDPPIPKRRAKTYSSEVKKREITDDSMTDDDEEEEEEEEEIEEEEEEEEGSEDGIEEEEEEEADDDDDGEEEEEEAIDGEEEEEEEEAEEEDVNNVSNNNNENDINDDDDDIVYNNNNDIIDNVDDNNNNNNNDINNNTNNTNNNDNNNENNNDNNSNTKEEKPNHRKHHHLNDQKPINNVATSPPNQNAAIQFENDLNNSIQADNLYKLENRSYEQEISEISKALKITEVHEDFEAPVLIAYPLQQLLNLDRITERDLIDAFIHTANTYRSIFHRKIFYLYSIEIFDLTQTLEIECLKRNIHSEIYARVSYSISMISEKLSKADHIQPVIDSINNSLEYTRAMPGNDDIKEILRSLQTIFFVIRSFLGSIMPMNKFIESHKISRQCDYLFITLRNYHKSIDNSKNNKETLVMNECRNNSDLGSMIAKKVDELEKKNYSILVENEELENEDGTVNYSAIAIPDLLLLLESLHKKMAENMQINELLKINPDSLLNTIIDGTTIYTIEKNLLSNGNAILIDQIPDFREVIEILDILRYIHVIFACFDSIGLLSYSTAVNLSYIRSYIRFISGKDLLMNSSLINTNLGEKLNSQVNAVIGVYGDVSDSNRYLKKLYLLKICSLKFYNDNLETFFSLFKGNIPHIIPPEVRQILKYETESGYIIGIANNDLINDENNENSNNNNNYNDNNNKSKTDYLSYHVNSQFENHCIDFLTKAVKTESYDQQMNSSNAGIMPSNDCQVLSILIPIFHQLLTECKNEGTIDVDLASLPFDENSRDLSNLQNFLHFLENIGQQNLHFCDLREMIQGIFKCIGSITPDNCHAVSVMSHIGRGCLSSETVEQLVSHAKGASGFFYVYSSNVHEKIKKICKFYIFLELFDFIISKAYRRNSVYNTYISNVNLAPSVLKYYNIRLFTSSLIERISFFKSEYRSKDLWDLFDHTSKVFTNSVKYNMYDYFSSMNNINGINIFESINNSNNNIYNNNNNNNNNIINNLNTNNPLGNVNDNVYNLTCTLRNLISRQKKRDKLFSSEDYFNIDNPSEREGILLEKTFSTTDIEITNFLNMIDHPERRACSPTGVFVTINDFKFLNNSYELNNAHMNLDDSDYINDNNRLNSSNKLDNNLNALSNLNDVNDLESMNKLIKKNENAMKSPSFPIPDHLLQKDEQQRLLTVYGSMKKERESLVDLELSHQRNNEILALSEEKIRELKQAVNEKMEYFLRIKDRMLSFTNLDENRDSSKKELATIDRHVEDQINKNRLEYYKQFVQKIQNDIKNLENRSAKTISLNHFLKNLLGKIIIVEESPSADVDFQGAIERTMNLTNDLFDILRTREVIKFDDFSKVDGTVMKVFEDFGIITKEERETIEEIIRDIEKLESEVAEQEKRDVSQANITEEEQQKIDKYKSEIEELKTEKETLSKSNAGLVLRMNEGK